MATLNKVMLIGRLTDNPEPPRVLPNSGSTVVRFRFAVGRGRKDPNTGQWVNDPNPLYIDCEAFSRPENTKLTDLITQYCTRGMQLYVEGRLQLDQWTDRDNPSVKRSKHKVIVEAIQFLDARNTDESSQGGGGVRGATRPQQSPQRPTPSPTDDHDMGPAEGDFPPF